jgi:hypothetical protein
MRRLAVFLLGLTAVLAALSALGFTALQRTSRAWFERDLALRDVLAVTAARRGLARAWGDPARLREALDDISRDERIMAAAACGADGVRRAET